MVTLLSLFWLLLGHEGGNPDAQASGFPLFILVSLIGESPERVAREGEGSPALAVTGWCKLAITSKG